MAITPATTGLPANYSDPSITRYGLINALNVINVRAIDDYFDTYGFIPYGALNQLMGNEYKSENKEFRWYQGHGRVMGFVTSSTAVSVAAGAPATIIVGSGNYTFNGTKSLPAEGMIFYNSRTGVESRVTGTPNKTTPNAHTFVLTPVISTENASTLAGDELLSRGFKYLGEASDETATIIRNIDRYSNYCTELRADSKIGDLAMAEKMEIQINGNYAYWYKQMKDDNLRLMCELDYLLFEGTQTNNLPYVEEGTNGVIKQVQANGINGTYNTFGVTTTFAQIERVLNSVGASKEYDILSDNSSYIEMQNAIYSEMGVQGSIVYADNSGKTGGIDIDRRFNSVRVYSRKYNFTNFGLFDEQTVYGSSGAGLRNRFSLFMPQGSAPVVDKYTGTTVKTPKFSVMYQTPNGGNKWHTGETGLFAENPNTAKAERAIHTIGYFGPRVVGAQQYLILKGQ